MYKGGWHQTGYLTFGEGSGNCRYFFVDVIVASTLGVNIHRGKKTKAGRLKPQDPRITNKYNKCLRFYVRRYSLSEKALLLQERNKCLLSTHLTEEPQPNNNERFSNV